jgi:hypothetical protein
MPPRVARSGTRGRPPSGFGGYFGRRRAMASQRWSGTRDVAFMACHHAISLRFLNTVSMLAGTTHPAAGEVMPGEPQSRVANEQLIPGSTRQYEILLEKPLLRRRRHSECLPDRVGVLVRQTLAAAQDRGLRRVGGIEIVGQIRIHQPEVEPQWRDEQADEQGPGESMAHCYATHQ